MSQHEGDNSYYKPFVIAIILHVVLIVFIVMSFSSRFSKAQLNAGQHTNIIHAHAVMQSQQQKKVIATIKKLSATKPLAVKSAPTDIKKPVAKPKQVIFKPKYKSKPKLKKSKPPLKPTLTQAQRMKALAKKLQQQAQKNIQTQVKTEQQQLDKQLAQAQHVQGIVDKYRALILQQVGQNWLVPEVNKNISCRLLITLAPGGTVLNVKLVKSSGNAALDRSAIQAVYKASPLPVPNDNNAFNAMRELDMIVRPESAVSKTINAQESH